MSSVILLLVSVGAYLFIYSFLGAFIAKGIAQRGGGCLRVYFGGFYWPLVLVWVALKAAYDYPANELQNRE